jgi:hypothetical protein
MPSSFRTTSREVIFSEGASLAMASVLDRLVPLYIRVGLEPVSEEL